MTAKVCVVLEVLLCTAFKELDWTEMADVCLAE